MNSPEPGLGQLLTTEESRKYMTTRFGLGWLRLEVKGRGQPYFDQLEGDMRHFHKVRERVRECLQSSEAMQEQAAAAWSSFLKIRLEALDSWSTSFTSFGAVVAAGFVVFALQEHAQTSTNFFSAGAAGVVAFVMAAYRTAIERRKSWYRYLIAHLDIIKSESPK